MTRNRTPTNALPTQIRACQRRPNLGANQVPTHTNALPTPSLGTPRTPQGLAGLARAASSTARASAAALSLRSPRPELHRSC